ncbi:hypothetical protein ACH44C_27755 [Streptomyces purpureus]|uniref:hypothetical protein n=1 Tax=Streptomyces purpureus TaxID=1951 RepID=UPI0037B4FCAE
MNARRVNAAADVICRAMKQGKTLPAGWAAALESACLLQSPEIAAEQRETLGQLERRTNLLREVQKLARQRMAEAKGRKAYGDRLKAENAELRARVAVLEAERHSTNEALSDAAQELRVQRDRIAALEALTPAPIQTCRTCSAGYTYGQPCSTCEFQARMATELAARQRQQEDPHDGPNHHDYALGRDLPEVTS